MPDQYPSALSLSDLNLTVVIVVLLVVALAAYAIKCGNHVLDFNWGWADLRLKVKANEGGRRRPIRGRGRRGRRGS